MGLVSQTEGVLLVSLERGSTNATGYAITTCSRTPAPPVAQVR